MERIADIFLEKNDVVFVGEQVSRKHHYSFDACQIALVALYEWTNMGKLVKKNSHYGNRIRENQISRTRPKFVEDRMKTGIIYGGMCD